MLTAHKTFNPFVQSWSEDNDWENDDSQWYDRSTSYQRRIKPMSLAVVLAGKNGIVMASDSREVVQAGGLNYHRDDVHKLSSFSDYIEVMSVGNSVGFSNWLIDYFVSKTLPDTKCDCADLKELSDTFSKFLKEKYERYTKGVNPNWWVLPENLIIFTMAGYTKEGIPQIIRLTNTGRQLPFTPELLDEPYFFSGVDTVAHYLIRKIEAKISIKEMDTELLKRVVVRMITETAKIDDHVALPIDMVVIEKDAPIMSIGKGELAKMDIDDSLRKLLEDD